MSITAMKQALEALEELHCTGDTQVFDLCYAPKVIPALRTAIEQAEKQEPVTWDTPDQPFNDWWDADYDDSANPFDKESPAYWAWAGWQAALHTKRQLVELTELEKAEITSLKWWDWEDTFDIDGFIKAIEAKLKEKNT
jgi:hypothetical protein